MNIAIVGAGITGICVAEWLRRDGWSVTLIDPVEPGSPEQTSYGNAGLISRTSVMARPAEKAATGAPTLMMTPSCPSLAME